VIMHAILMENSAVEIAQLLANNAILRHNAMSAIPTKCLL